MDEHFVGYLLKTLDEETHLQVDAYLNEHPEARARLERIRQGLAPLTADAEPAPPPPGLVLNTLARVAEYRCRPLPTAPIPSRSQVGSGRTRFFRRADVLVAACLLVAVGGLCAPLLVRQWNAYHRTACQKNLKDLWGALSNYSDDHNDKFPSVAENTGPLRVAGAFVPVLHSSGLLPANVSIECPAQGRREPLRRTVRELEELARTDPAEFQAIVRELTGGYAYSLGYKDGDTYHDLRRRRGPDEYLPILADRCAPDGQGNSLNHGGTGQNVLTIGGSVRFSTTRNVGPYLDDIYLNRDNKVRAGVSVLDAVLAPGDATPSQPDED